MLLKTEMLTRYEMLPRNEMDNRNGIYLKYEIPYDTVKNRAGFDSIPSADR